MKRIVMLDLNPALHNQSSLRLFFSAVGIPSEWIDFEATDFNPLMG
ncbi:hypothetical protein [Flavobacterium sp. TSSA_36]